MNKMLLIFLLVPSILMAEQTVISDYGDARDNYFYDRLYTGNVGESLYCGITRPISVGGGRSLEHVMPADWMAEHFGCTNRNCSNPVYRHAEGDLHIVLVARLQNSESEFSVKDVVELSSGSTNPFKSSGVNQMLNNLSDSGLVFKNRHGKYSFAVPLMGGFILREVGEMIDFNSV